MVLEDDVPKPGRQRGGASKPESVAMILKAGEGAGVVAFALATGSALAAAEQAQATKERTKATIDFMLTPSVAFVWSAALIAWIPGSARKKRGQPRNDEQKIERCGDVPSVAHDFHWRPLRNVRDPTPSPI